MKRTAFWLCTVILMGVTSAPAQYHGGGGHHGGGSPSGPTPETKANDVSGFERAIALQATPEQTVQFDRLRASTRQARTRAQELLLLPAAADNADWLRKAGPLSDAVVDAQDEGDKFLQSFSKEQREGLKKIVKRLQKLDSELTSGGKDLDRSLHQEAASADQIAGVAGRLDKALGDLQSEQRTLAEEMGIQDNKPPLSAEDK